MPIPDEMIVLEGGPVHGEIIMAALFDKNTAIITNGFRFNEKYYYKRTNRFHSVGVPPERSIFQYAGTVITHEAPLYFPEIENT